MGARILKISKHKPSIFQGSFRFSSKRAGLSLTAEHPIESVTFRVLLVALVVLAGSYVYFVSASVLNVIARKEALKEAASLGSAVALLERDYYTATIAVTPKTGMGLGLSPVSETRYVHRPGSVGAVETPPNEI